MKRHAYRHTIRPHLPRNTPAAPPTFFATWAGDAGAVPALLALPRFRLPPPPPSSAVCFSLPSVSGSGSKARSWMWGEANAEAMLCTWGCAALPMDAPAAPPPAAKAAVQTAAAVAAALPAEGDGGNF